MGTEAAGMSQPQPARLRPARHADVSGLLPLLLELCAGDRAVATAALEAALADGPPGHEAVVAELPGDPAGPAGFLALSPSSAPHFRLGSVEWIAVAPTARRRGIGRALLGHALQRATELGWRQLRVSTFHTNRAALHLYIEMGFHPDATLHDYAGPGLHYVELVRPLPAGDAAAGERGDAERADPR